MGADAWETCPFCHNRPEEYPDGIEHLRGEVSPDEFLKLENEIERREAEETVREDYDVSLSDEEFMCVWIRAKCLTCGATWEFQKTNIARN